MSKQPQWKLVARLGDVNPLDYGGGLVFVDETGVYPPECEVIVPPDCEGEGPTLFYRILLEKCWVVGSSVCDNKFHPGYPAWFNASIGDAARACGLEREAVVKMLCSDNAGERASGYEVVWGYIGLHEFDSDPQRHNKRQAAERYARLTAK